MSGFDDIINRLDSWLDRKPEPERVQNPEAPRFVTGNKVLIRETTWNGRVLQRTGLYSDPGFPRLQDLDVPTAELDWKDNRALHGKLKERLVGTVNIGDVCRVLANWFSEEDRRWYYFIDNGKPDGKGWTRCDFRFIDVTDGRKAPQR